MQRREEIVMRFDLAPMEGATDAIYRAVHRRLFGGVDLYWMPFWSPTQDHILTRRVLREILPEHNEGVPVLPQLLTKSAEDFLWAAGELAAMGYGEVNLNLGCPSGTVTAKGKGAGFLADLPRLERFLDRIFAEAPLRISIKTRLGTEDPEEFGPLLELYGRYPLARLAVHARVLRDQYRLPARPEAFRLALERSGCPVCCNGDLKTLEDCRSLAERYPAACSVMVGRGILADPALARRFAGGRPAERRELLSFHRMLFDGYRLAFGSGRNAMLRMKEHWRYLIRLLEGGAGFAKKLRKAADPGHFDALAEAALAELPLRQGAAPDW